MKDFLDFFKKIGFGIAAVAKFIFRFFVGFVKLLITVIVGFIPFCIRVVKGFVPFCVGVVTGFVPFCKWVKFSLTHMTKKDWANVWDKVTTALLLALFATPFGILAYILLWFVNK